MISLFPPSLSSVKEVPPPLEECEIFQGSVPPKQNAMGVDPFLFIFALTITYEGHFPFRDVSFLSPEKEQFPISFIPNFEARLDPNEWHRYEFSAAHVDELDLFAAGGSPSPSGGEGDAQPLLPPAQEDQQPIAFPPSVG